METVGDFRIRSIINGRFRLDGGAMFGVVPKPVWSRKSRSDDLNRISLAMRTLLVIDDQAKRVILVDTGAGHKWPAEEADRYAIVPDPHSIPNALADEGLSESDVTDIVVTHLHFDHNGGLTEWAGEPGGPTRLRFPKARHWIHERHWQHAHHPSLRDRASFLPRDMEALAEPGVLQMVTGDRPAPPFAGLSWQLSHGHTPYQLLPRFHGQDRDLLFVGDMIPTSNHLNPPWLMAYDLQPLVTLEEKRSVYRECNKSGLAIAFPHDPELGGCTLRCDGSKVVVETPLTL
jgi:glyoxylase-like metal-dependent hydrolase (beta-lactamase superfamily II)